MKTLQRVPVLPAIESDRAGKRRVPRIREDSSPLRCQLWDHRRLVSVVPVTFDDMGHPSDVYFNPTSVEKITRIAFVWGGRVFPYPLGEEVIIRPGNPLHLMLAHLKLRDKFGNTVIGAGR